MAGGRPDSVLAFKTSGTFRKEDYIAAGYTHAQVLIVGAAGGDGKDYRQTSGAQRYFPASTGAGGGIYVPTVELAPLATSLAVTIGAVGANSTANGDSNNRPAGAAGGTSSFGGYLASGGGGGASVFISNGSSDGNTSGAGPTGGSGNTNQPGGTYGGPRTGEAAKDGTWDGSVGSGGFGAGGGYADYSSGAGGTTNAVSAGGGTGAPGGIFAHAGTPASTYVDPNTGYSRANLTPGRAGGAVWPSGATWKGDGLGYGSSVPGANPNGLVVMRFYTNIP